MHGSGWASRPTAGEQATAMSFSSLHLLPRQLLAAPVHGYRLLLKPWLGNACRFEPTCSAYVLLALDRHGAIAGGWLGTKRLLRCHPWCDGGIDPVPETAASSVRTTPDAMPTTSAGPGGPANDRQESP
jgi:putative membrane protein insertion efficiency factor